MSSLGESVLVSVDRFVAAPVQRAIASDPIISAYIMKTIHVAQTILAQFIGQDIGSREGIRNGIAATEAAGGLVSGGACLRCRVGPQLHLAS